MNGFLILLLSAAALCAGYWLYGKRIERSWGVDPEAATPAIRRRDRTDFMVTRSRVLLAHEFVTVCAVLVIFGPAVAARYGWLPVLAWILLGSVFIGGVMEYTAVYVSVKSRGLTLGGLFERFGSLRWKRLFLVFAWALCVVTVAVFADIAARTLNGFIDLEELDTVQGSAGTVVLLLYGFAVLVGLAGRYSQIKPWATRAITFTILLCSFMLGLLFPIAVHPTLWHTLILGFAVLSASGPVWLTLHPRAHMHTFLYIGLLLLAVVGIVFGGGRLTLPAVTGFVAEGKPLFPWLFVAVTCGAASGLQALTASSVISRQLRSEGRMHRIAYGAVMAEAFVAVIVLVCVAAGWGAAGLAEEPGAVFISGVGAVLAKLGISQEVSGSLYSLLIACMCIGALETLARAARVSWQEFFDYGKQEPNLIRLALTNPWVGGGVTLLAALGIARIGYSAVLPLVGIGSLALGALALLICAVWLRDSGRSVTWLWPPMVLLFLISMTALVLTVVESVLSIVGGGGDLIADAVRAVLSLAVFVTLALLGYQGFRRLLEPEEAPDAE